MAKLSQKKKKEIIDLLSVNLSFFYPKLSKVFMCPVCLKRIDIRKLHEISEAHIIPDAAGGKRITFLCRKCNSDFGHNQDKWFGELIRLIESKENIVQTQIKEGSFLLCNKKVQGRFEYSLGKGMEVFIHKDRNPPEINDYVLRQFQKERNKTFSFSLPILARERMISVGFLTAAYLLWFDTFGYSWVLQSYLDQIREQILSPDKLIINNLHVLRNEIIEDKCWIGVTQISGYLVLAAGFSGYMIMIPPIHCRNLYVKLDELITTSIDGAVDTAGFYPIYFKNRHFYGVPVSLMFDNKIMFAPDAMAAGKLETMTIYFSSSDSAAKFLYPVDDKRLPELSGNPEVEKRRIKLRGKIEAKHFDI